MDEVNPNLIANSFKASIRDEIESSNFIINIVGFLSNEDLAAIKYAEYTKKGCEDVGINFKLKKVSKLEIENKIKEANMDCDVHGIFVYYPIFNLERDNKIKDLIDPKKDIEGLSQYWVQKLYENNRYDELGYKAILPCTPLAIIKILAAIKINVRGKKITIFNRSEVVGRPLAKMLAHDGGEVYSFDEAGPLLFKNGDILKTDISREEALLKSSLIITGVPSSKFHKIQKDEIPKNCIGLNFSTLQNFSAESIAKLDVFIPRVGPLTVTMCMRNALRLFQNYRLSSS